MCSSMKKLNHFQQKTSKLNLALFWVSVDFLLWFCQASVCFSVFVSSKQRFGVTDIKAPSACHSSHVSTDHVAAIRQISVTALFYLGDSRKIDLRVVRAHRSKDMKRRAPQRAGAGEREREGQRESVSPLAPFFDMFFLPRWSRPMQIGLSQERCSTWSPHSGPRTFLWPSCVLFSWAFPFLVF